MKKFFLWLSQGANMALYGGDPDESLSARAWRLREEPKWADIHRKIDSFLGLGHCKRASEQATKRSERRSTQ